MQGILVSIALSKCQLCDSSAFNVHQQHIDTYYFNTQAFSFENVMGTRFTTVRLSSNKYKIFTQELDKFFFIILMQTGDFSGIVMAIKIRQVKCDSSCGFISRFCVAPIRYRSKWPLNCLTSLKPTCWRYYSV